jgi:hypothetical protein
MRPQVALEWSTAGVAAAFRLHGEWLAGVQRSAQVLLAILGIVGGVATKPTAAEHMYSVAGQEETRNEKSRSRRTE